MPQVLVGVRAFSAALPAHRSPQGAGRGGPGRPRGPSASAARQDRARARRPAAKRPIAEVSKKQPNMHAPPAVTGPELAESPLAGHAAQHGPTASTDVLQVTRHWFEE